MEQELQHIESYLLVQGWSTVQAYCGTMMSTDLMRTAGIKVASTNRGRGKKALYKIPFSFLRKQLVLNKQRKERIDTSIDLIEVALRKEA